MRKLMAIALMVAASRAVATQAVAVSVEELARQSDAVVRGQVVEKHAQRTEDGLRIFTVVELQRAAALRGRAQPRLQVVVPGGIVGRMGQRVDGAPSFIPGEEVVVFLQRAGAERFRVTGLAQGKFTVTGGRAYPDLSHLTFVRTSVGAGERRVEEMPLQELERRVRSTR
jgi:hypothetical protein